MVKDTIILVEHQRHIPLEILDLCHDKNTILITRSDKSRHGFDHVISIHDTPIEDIPLEQIKSFFSNGKIGAYTPFEEAVLDCEIIKDLLGLEDSNLAAIHLTRNKYLFRKSLSEDPGLHVDHALVESGDDMMAFFQNGREQAIMKPILGVSSILTNVITQSNGFNILYEMIKLGAKKAQETELVKQAFLPFQYEDRFFDPTEQFLIEDYMGGKELSVEAVIIDSELTILAVHQAPEKQTELEDTSFIAHAPISDHQKDMIHSAIQQAVSLLGLRNRVICAEVMLTDTVKLIEINPRPGGLGTVKSVEMLTGVNMHEMSMSLALGNKEPIALTPSVGAYGFCAIYTSQSGILKSVDGIDSDNIYLHLYYEIGSYLDIDPMDIPYLGYIAVAGDHYDEVNAKIQKAIKQLKITVE